MEEEEDLLVDPTIVGRWAVRGTVVILVLAFAWWRAVGYYEGIISAKDQRIAETEILREAAEEQARQQREIYEQVRRDSIQRDAQSQEAILSLRTEVGKLQGSIRRLAQANTRLEEELLAAPSVIESATDSEIANAVQTKISEVYPQYTNSFFEFDPVDDLFEVDRMGANAFSLSLDEVSNLRMRLDNSESIIELDRSQIVKLEEIILAQDERIGSWTARTMAAEGLVGSQEVLISTLSDERDAWEDKSNAQGRQLFFYRWGTRIGIAAVAGVAVIVATR